MTLNMAMLQVAAERLAFRWRPLASPIEPYAPPAAVAYLQATENLEAEMKKQDTWVNVLVAFRKELVTALRRVG